MTTCWTISLKCHHQMKIFNILYDIEIEGIVYIDGKLCYGMIFSLSWNTRKVKSRMRVMFLADILQHWKQHSND